MNKNRLLNTVTSNMNPFIKNKIPRLKCAILDDYQKVALAAADWSPLLNSIELQAFHQYFPKKEELIHAIREQDILVIMRERTKFDADVLSSLPNLKLIVTSGMRNAAINLKKANELGITVCGTELSSQPPIELTWALILGLTRHVSTENSNLKSGGWQSTLGISLQGKQLGVIGLGKIGAKVAEIGKAFGMNIVAWSQNLTKDKTDALGISLASSKEALLSSSDFVSIHLVLSERTRNLISTPDIAQMRPTAFLINTARAPIVNENDLIQALQNKQIAGAGLDVFDIEPLPSQHPFRTLPTVLATPHIGYVTQENYQLIFRQVVENIEAFLKNSPIRALTTVFSNTSRIVIS